MNETVNETGLFDSYWAILDTQIATRADIYQVEKNLEKRIESNSNKILAVIAIAVAFLALFLS
jgi:hypothetical protein